MILRLSILILILSSISCLKKKEFSDQLDPKETLRINLNAEPPSLDWHKATDRTSFTVINNLMDGLVDFDLKDLSLKPSLATHWKSSQKNKVWVFYLRQDVKWTDGRAFKASDVVDGWERLLNPNTGSEYAYFLFNIKNAKKYNKGLIKDFSKVGVSVIGKNQLRVELESSQAYFPSLTAHQSAYPVRKDIVKKYQDAWVRPENIVTLGAYKLNKWAHDSYIILERNETYYSEKAKTKYVLARIVKKMFTAINLFDKKKLDVQQGLPFSEIKKYKQRSDFFSYPILSIFYLGFNTKKAPMNDVRVRKAISYAIDKKQITDLLAAGQLPLNGWIPKGMFGYEKNIGLKFDLKKANRILDEIGYKDRSKFPKITLAFNTNENNQQIFENLQSQLKKNLNIEVELQNEEWKVYLNRMSTNPPHIYRMGWLADYPDPDNFFSLMTGDSENNYTGWKNKKFDKCVKEALSPSRAERKRIYRRCHKILMEQDVPVVNLFSQVYSGLISPRVKFYPKSSMGREAFKDVVLDDK